MDITYSIEEAQRTGDFDRHIQAAGIVATNNRSWCEAFLARGGKPTGAEWQSHFQLAEQATGDIGTLRFIEREFVRNRDARRTRERFNDDTPVIQYGARGGVAGVDHELFNQYIRSGNIDPSLEQNEDGVVLFTGEDMRAATERFVVTVGDDFPGGVTVVPTPERGAHDSLAQSAFRRAGAPIKITDSDTYQEFRMSGNTGVWLPEVPTGSESSDPDGTMFSAVLKKFGHLHLISEQHRSDSRIDQAAMIIENAMDNVAVAEDYGLMAGTGIGLEPAGMLGNAAITTVDIEGTTATTISNTLSDLGSATKIVKNLIGALPSRFHDGAAFMMHGSTWSAVRSLTDGEGRPYFAETFQGFTLAGYPVYLNDSVQVGGTANQKVIVFGNFRKGFRIANKPEGVTVKVLNERYAERDLVGLRVRYRIGGGVYLPSAFVIGVADAVS